MLTDYEKCSDAQLVQLYQKGNERAGSVLCERYWVILYEFLKRKIGNSEDAEDLVQETLIEASESMKKGQTPVVFRSWVLGIATHVRSRWIKAQQKQGVKVSLEAVPEDASEQVPLIEVLPASVTFEPEYGVIDQEFEAIRLRFERTLPPKELAVFQLRSNDRMKFEEIASKLGIRSGTAKVRHHRAKKKFETWLEKNYPNTYRLLSGEVISCRNSYWLFSSFFIEYDEIVFEVAASQTI